MKKLSLLLSMMAFMVTFTIAQRSVTGSIVDSDGLTLIGANVTVPNTTIGTITDTDGNFSLSVPSDAAQLMISYTGFETAMINLDSESNYMLILREGQILDEIVVTAGGLEKNKARIGYAIQNVSADELVKSKEVNIVDAINSKVAGVSVVSSSGSPGASSSIRVRGSTSINGTNSPLFVVDGVPIDNSEIGAGVGGVDQSNRAIDLNPNDVESMTILKGPSATALYGVRAANGAVIITTKKGQAGEPKVTVSAGYTFDRANKFNERQSTYAQGRPLSGVPTWRGPETGEGFSWGPAIADLEFDGSDYDFDSRGRLVAQGTGNGTSAQAYDPYDFFVTGKSYDLNASVSGGTDALSYYFSGGTLSSEGIVPNATFARNSFRMNLNSIVSDKLKVGMGLNFTQSGGVRIQRGSNVKGVMLGLLRNTPTFDIGNGLVGQEAADLTSTYALENGNQRSYRSGIYDSPYWTVNKNPSTDDVNRVIGNINLNYMITNDLSATYRAGLDNYSDRRNSAIDINPGRDVGSVGQAVITNRDINQDFFLTYTKDVSSNFDLSANAGFNSFDHRYVAQSVNGTTLSAPNFYHISNATDLVASESFGTKRLYGAYGTVDLAFNDYLFVNLTGRNDWSSILPADANTFQSYSASAGFAFTEALDINSSILDYGKLRASIGKVGNDGGDAFIYSTTNYLNQASISGDGFLDNNGFPNYGTNAFERDILLGNPTLRPEKTTTWELGTVLKFFGGRLGLDVNYFDSKSEDQIIAVDLSATTGFTNSVENAGVITNKGWEIVLDGTPVRNSNFSWDVALNFTAMESTVESLKEGIDDIGLNGFTSTSVDVVPGQPFSVIYGNGFQRTDGGDVVVGADGWPLVDPTKKALGDPNPDWTLGFNNNLTFGNFSVGMLFDIRSGGDVWCGTCGIMNYFGTSQQSADERDDVVTFEGVVNTGTADEPVYAENTTAVSLADPNGGVGSYYRVRYGFGGISEMNIHDASWVRLRNVSVGYDLPSTMFDNSFVGGINIQLSARNLWLSTDYPGVDPETNLTGASNGYGLDYFNMPNTKSYSATVKLSF